MSSQTTFNSSQIKTLHVTFTEAAGSNSSPRSHFQLRDHREMTHMASFVFKLKPHTLIVGTTAQLIKGGSFFISFNITII